MVEKRSASWFSDLQLASLDASRDPVEVVYRPGFFGFYSGHVTKDEAMPKKSTD